MENSTTQFSPRGCRATTSSLVSFGLNVTRPASWLSTRAETVCGSAKRLGSLRNFGSLAKTVEANVHTDIPLSQLSSLVRLLGKIEPAETLTVTFDLDYVFARRKADRHPVPHLGRMHATVRNAILNPELLQKTGKATTTRQSC